MELHILKPRKALNKAFLKVKPNRTEIESFKTNLTQLLDSTNDTESEEFHKNLVIDFLKKTYYDPNHFVNTKGRNDLVIHNGDKAASTVGVIIEAKKPTNKSEMLTKDKINAKAFQELILYYLRERITLKNIEIKYLIATNINEWFIFDATIFDRLFAQNKNLVKQFNDFEGGRLADTKTDFFYKQIAEPFISEIKLNKEEQKERDKAMKKQKVMLSLQKEITREMEKQKLQSLHSFDVLKPSQIEQTIYDVFVSHASEDKDEFVRPFVNNLQENGLKVWYDEFSLRIGDSLRRSIDNGLKNSRYGIVVLSEAFFNKEWPQRELDGLFAREVNGEKVILPIWHKISKNEVLKFSPIIADMLALNTSSFTIEEIAKEISDRVLN
jgi:hypothetical protein